MFMHIICIYVCTYIHIYVHFIAIVLQVNIPSADTTYWCKTQRIPQEVIDQTHYITSVSEINEIFICSYVNLYACIYYAYLIYL